MLWASRELLAAAASSHTRDMCSRMAACSDADSGTACCARDRAVLSGLRQGMGQILFQAAHCSLLLGATAGTWLRHTGLHSRLQQGQTG